MKTEITESFQGQAKVGNNMVLSHAPLSQAQAEHWCREKVKEGATFAAILRESNHHPNNAGKYFLHRFVKA